MKINYLYGIGNYVITRCLHSLEFQRNLALLFQIRNFLFNILIVEFVNKPFNHRICNYSCNKIKQKIMLKILVQSYSSLFYISVHQYFCEKYSQNALCKKIQFPLFKYINFVIKYRVI